MTVKELIEELKKYDPGMLVYTSDSENGPEECGSVEIRKDEWVWRGVDHSVQDVLVIN